MTFQITCNCGCGEAVTATDAGFSATTVEVTACSSLKAQGIASTNWRKSSLAIVSDVVETHRDALVVLV